MLAGPRPRLALLAALALTVSACSVDPGANPAFGCEGCEGSCVMGFCLQREDGGVAGSGALDGGADAGGSGPPRPEACDEPGKSEFCYDGPGGTATIGRCKAGMRVCGEGSWSSCLGQILPEEEQCNRQDDDCDGELDEDVTLGTCSTGQPGVCDVGMLRCETGIAVCARATDPSPEQCNGSDDDCDGDLDEDVSSVCYPAAPDGCVEDGAGGFTCMGMCVPGVASCIDGEPQPCEGAVEPASEVCGSSGPAQDEDCDGQADNGCACGAGDSQDCYSGPLDTLDVGTCEAGSQACDPGSNTYGECMGEVLPAVEDCSNEGADDDCNGIDDDIRERGEPCTIDDAMGVCRDGWLDCAGDTLGCQGPAAGDETCNDLDDDCDGRTDEGLLEDVLNCGRCGVECGTGQDCCGGSCVEVGKDPLHCGRCGNDCGAGLDCCSGSCVDVQTNSNHCGACDRSCAFGGCCRNRVCSNIVCL